MDFADVLRRRKAVRSYLPDPVPREVLERIVARGRKIPSAGHSQGLRLVVVTDEETRRAMAELALEPEYVAAGLEPWISRAPAHIVVCVREEDYRARYREPDKTHGEEERVRMARALLVGRRGGCGDADLARRARRGACLWRLRHAG